MGNGMLICPDGSYRVVAVASGWQHAKQIDSCEVG